MSNKKNVLIISTPDINNAAGVIAYDLHKGLSSNYNSQLLVKRSNIKAAGVLPFYKNVSVFQKFINRVIRKIKRMVLKPKTNLDYAFFDFNQNKSLIKLTKLEKKIKKPDYIIAYFMQNFFTIKDLYNLQKYYKAPILLIMADMVYITGGCHYAWDCEGYKKDCSNCPAILENKHKHFAFDNLKLNKILINEMDISIISGSTQDLEYAKESTLFKSKNISVVFGGINLDIFNFQNKQDILKIKYKILNNNFVILFGATSLETKRKGVKYYIEAINYLENIYKDDNVTIVSIGKGRLEDLLPNTKFNIVNLGYISDYNKLAEVYNIADVFVTTTIQDSGPMMINQSIACGTPVICFDIGVARDIVLNSKTGYTVDLYNSKGISESVYNIYKLSNKEIKTMRTNCYSLAKKEYSLKVSSEKISEIIEND